MRVAVAKCQNRVHVSNLGVVLWLHHERIVAAAQEGLPCSARSGVTYRGKQIKESAMLELGGSKAPEADLIKEGSDATFMQDVVEASKTTPVIVDFWAPWCGPCKTLGPALEAAVTKARGAVKMVKIDVDQNQVYAGQLQVQSIPTVYAFYKGQPVDGFQGAVPPSQIEAFVAKLAKMAGGSVDGGLSEAVEVAEQMIEDGQAQDAADTFVAILQEDGANVAAYAGLIRAVNRYACSPPPAGLR